MISFQEALDLCLARSRHLGSETVLLGAALGRILAAPVRSDVDFPPFDKSAMDGFACRRQDLSLTLEILETIAAGKMPTKMIGAGQCAKIMTGAPIPKGADCVVMVEQSEILPHETVRFKSQQTDDNICFRGEDLRQGDLVLPAGKVIGCADLAALAGAGCATLEVARRPIVTVLATGSELVPANVHPTNAQIRDSNSYQLCAQIAEVGAIAIHGGIVPDTPEETLAAIAKAQRESDVLILSGGVSMGEFDCVPEALKSLGFRMHFQSVAMQPGRPTHFGESEKTFCFGLPGNPVSTFVVFELLVKPFLLQMMGCAHKPTFIGGVMTKAIRRKATARQSTYPLRMSVEGDFEPVDYHGAAHIHSMISAQALLTLPPFSEGVSAGERVRARWIATKSS